VARLHVAQAAPGFKRWQLWNVNVVAVKQIEPLRTGATQRRLKREAWRGECRLQLWRHGKLKRHSLKLEHEHYAFLTAF
jgi:hypothetical protein